MTLSPSEDQSQAIKKAGNRDNWNGQIFRLQGFAGSGKTTIAQHIVDEYGARRPLYCAPTNKAAKVLSSKIGCGAISIHKAIYTPPDELEDGELAWTLNPDGPAANADLIIVDEASMVGTKLGTDLSSFGRPILAIGDPGQLPPVKDTPYLCAGEPDFLLSKIHRQAEGNPIIALSRDIREGKKMTVGTMGDEVKIVRKGTVDIPEANPPQVIVGIHDTRFRITSAMRSMMGIEDPLPVEGERLICVKNSEVHGDLINGQECTAVSFTADQKEKGILNAVVDVEGQRVSCRSWDGPFEDHWKGRVIRRQIGTTDYYQSLNNERFDFGWAITCHKAQGSQWDDVLVYDEGRIFREEAVRFRYTAVTRAAKTLTVVIP